MWLVLLPERCFPFNRRSAYLDNKISLVAPQGRTRETKTRWGQGERGLCLGACERGVAENAGRSAISFAHRQIVSDRRR
jgi:hypothetical protein